MTNRVCGGGVGKRARGASAALAIAGSIVGGCWGTAGGPGTGPATVDVVVASTSRRPPMGAVTEHAWAAPEPTTWPLPYASYYADLPPAGEDGGPTRPCAPHVDWGTSAPLPAGSGRQAGLGCKDLKPVRYPACTEEQIGHARRLDSVSEEAIAFNQLVPSAFRGYLRRDRATDDGELWEPRLEAARADGSCSELLITFRPAGTDVPPPGHPGDRARPLCRGDASTACCVSALVGADAEVIYETGVSMGQLCVVSPAASQGSVREFRRSDETAFQGPTSARFVAP